MAYFIGLIVIAIIGAGLANATSDGVRQTSLLPSVATIALITALSAYRLQNIGKNGWIALLTPIPLVGFFFVILPGLICQEGYEQDKELDNIGRVLSALFVGCIVLVILIAVVGYLFR
jgi:uncharacterized membrane protein YhaH (DUF805 family)